MRSPRRSRRLYRGRQKAFISPIYGINVDDGSYEYRQADVPRFDGVSGLPIDPQNMGFQRGFPVDIRKSANTYDPLEPLADMYPDMITYDPALGKASKPAGRL